MTPVRPWHEPECELNIICRISALTFRYESARDCVCVQVCVVLVQARGSSCVLFIGLHLLLRQAFSLSEACQVASASWSGRSKDSPLCFPGLQLQSTHRAQVSPGPLNNSFCLFHYSHPSVSTGLFHCG